MKHQDILDLDALVGPGDLPIKELTRKLKENPDDPAVKKQFAEFRQFIKKSLPDSQKRLDGLLDTPANVVDLAKQISSPKYRHRIAIVNGINLLGRIPSSRKYKASRKVAELFVDSSKVEKYKIAQSISPTVRNTGLRKKKLTKKIYLSRKKFYDDKITNRLKYLKKLALRLGFTFRSRGEFIEVVQNQDL